MNRRLSLALALTPLLFACGDSSSEASGGDGAPRALELAFVTNGVDPFWTIAEKGALAGGEQFGANVQVLMPTNGVAHQQQMVEDLLTRGVDGIAISPIDGENQTGLIDEACGVTHVVTHDSDAPDSRRRCFIGPDNYAAGRSCGQLVKEALPDGGTVMLFVGRLEQANARLRRQGVIDELLDRSHDASRYDVPGEALAGEKYTVLDTRTDGFDYARAKSNAEDALTLHADLGCMVGLFAYNVPNCLEALADAGKLGEVRVVSFDEDRRTLQAILGGHVHGTVTQQPYEYGLQSMRVLAGLARGDESVIPDGGFLDVPTRVIRADNVRTFWAELDQLTNERTLPADTGE